MKLKSASGFAGVCAEAGLTRKWIAPALALVLLAAVSFGMGNPRPAYAHDLCPNTGSPLGPFNMETYEDHRQTYARTFELAGSNQLLPELAGFALPGMETGPRSAGSSQLRPGYIPPVLLKAIAWIEASWAQADYSVPYGAAGPTLISHDCGYGLMQVTTGMQNVTGVPSVNQAMIGGHYAFNIARGAQIVIDKWNTAPEYRPIVGSRDPTILEDWYYAVWGYNGFSYKNHPLNPIYPANRLPYSCGPTNDGFGHNRTQYPYQELVFGCMQRPPIVAGVPLWTPQPVYLAQPSHPAFAGPLSNANWDACAYNLQCAPMDMPTPIPNNRDGTPLTVTRNQVIGTPVLSLSAQNIQIMAVPPSQTGTASLTIANSGTGVLSYRITSNVPWLRASRLQGVALGANLGGRTSTLQISADTLGLGAGRHTGTLTIESPLTANAPANVTVVVDTFPDGTLLKGSGPSIYVMSGSLKRPIPNWFTFFANGYDPSRIVGVSDAVLAAIPTGHNVLDGTTDGQLYQAFSMVWVMRGGARHYVSNAMFGTCGYGTDAVRNIPDGLINTLPHAPDIVALPCPQLSPPDGTLFLGSGPEVYVAKGGYKRHVPNWLSFSGHGMRWGNVNRLPGSAVSLMPTGNAYVDLRAQGTLIQGPGPEVYVIDGGVRRHIANGPVFDSCGYAWTARYMVDDVALGSLPVGPPLTGGPCPTYSPADGTLLQGDGPKVYVARGGLKRWIPDGSTLIARGFRWADVNRVPDFYITSMVEGNPVLSVLTTGHLARTWRPEIYVMENGTKRHVSTATVFQGCGYSTDAVVWFGEEILGIPTGPTVLGAPCPILNAPNGTLVRGSSTLEVWASQGGLLRHVGSPEVMAACGYRWGNVDVLPQGMVSIAPKGPPLLSGPCP